MDLKTHIQQRYTDYQLVNHVYENLLRQDAISIRDGGCAYRGSEGRRCAAGWLIDDEHYSRRLEERTANDSEVAEALIASGVGVQQLELVELLQCIHDGAGITRKDQTKYWGGYFIFIRDNVELGAEVLTKRLGNVILG